MVPEPRRSPTAMGQPVLVWWASIWGKEKRRFVAEVREIVVAVAVAVDFVPDWEAVK